MKKIYFYVVIITEAIVISFCTFLICNHFFSEKEKMITCPVISNESGDANKEMFSITDLENEIKNIEEFNTAKYYFSCQQHYAKSKTFEEVFGIFGNVEIPGTSTGFTYEYQGYVNAGVDFSKATVEMNGNIITIKLPKAEILGDVNWETTPRLLDEKKNILNPLSSKETTQAHENVKQHEKQNAIDSGILITAQENAEKVINAYINSFGKTFRNYEISITFNN